MSRLSELVATFAVAADAGMGMPMDHGLRCASAAVRVGELLGMSEAVRSDAFYLGMLRFAGCTADSDLAQDVMGDEVSVRGQLYGVDWGTPTEFLPAMARVVAGGKGLRGAAAFVRALSKMPKLLDTGRSHCEVGDRLAEQLGFHADFRAALFHSFERWDGRGWPSKVKGEAIALPMRLAQLGEDIEVGHRAGGVEGARALLRKRSGRSLDPSLVSQIAPRMNEACQPLESGSPWTTTQESEPGTPRSADDQQLDDAVRAMGVFSDLKSRYTRGHASMVAALCSSAAEHLRLAPEVKRTLERAAWVHDVGRVGVSAGIWDKPGGLTDAEWERVRTHTYVGERILSRATCLSQVAEIATLAHERVDGSGYHRRVKGEACVMAARVLAAADVYCALTEERPHRPARTPADAADTLSRLVKSGQLCPEATAAVLASAGHAQRPRAQHVAGLSDREIEVLRHLSRGLTNKEIATALDLSTKTVSRHLESIFSKMGVTTRAAATLFALQKGLMT
jgi:HD-GYP domain-containing protein (c-di-GMP phosphodiesterase class II)